jgi:hypothetical protein
MILLLYAPLPFTIHHPPFIHHHSILRGLAAYALAILLSMSSNALEETYSKICKIGSGSYGTVYLYERRKGYCASFLQ